MEHSRFERFFEGDEEGLAILLAVVAAVHRLGPAETRVGRSQVSFRRRRGFAYIWRPSRYLGKSTVPAVLSLALPRRLRSRRFKQVVNPSRGVWMHHLEVPSATSIDGQVLRWLRQAYDEAGEAAVPSFPCD